MKVLFMKIISQRKFKSGAIVIPLSHILVTHNPPPKVVIGRIEKVLRYQADLVVLNKEPVYLMIKIGKVKRFHHQFTRKLKVINKSFNWHVLNYKDASFLIHYHGVSEVRTLHKRALRQSFLKAQY
jgi:hypothetical protein